MTWQIVAVGFVGPAWSARSTMREQEGASDHLTFVGDLVSRGVLESAGPFAAFDEALEGELVGLLVFAGSDLDEADRVLNRDPAGSAGLIRWELRRWHR